MAAGNLPILISRGLPLLAAALQARYAGATANHLGLALSAQQKASPVLQEALLRGARGNFA